MGLHNAPRSIYFSVENTSFAPFSLWLGNGGRLQRRRARGTYEPHVMEFLDDHVDSDTVFWEIGAAWGYFSIAVASVATAVVAFEREEERAAKIEASMEVNGLQNVISKSEKVDGTSEFTSYPEPNICLVDIEGWEYSFLERFLPSHSRDMTWIVEIHDDLIGVEGGDSVSLVAGLFESNGYETEALNPYTSHNPHYVAWPDYP